MTETVLQAETGRRAGSSDARRLRAEGKIPAVVYGHGMDPLPVSVDRRELRQALSGAATSDAPSHNRSLKSERGASSATNAWRWTVVSRSGSVLLSQARSRSQPPIETVVSSRWWSE